MRCAVCGERARRHKFGSRTKYKDVIVCRAAGAKHIRWSYDDFYSEVVLEIQKMTEKVNNDEGEEVADKSELIRQAIEANKKRRARVQEGFENGVYEATEANTKLRELEKEAEHLFKKLEKELVGKTSQKEAQKLIQQIDLYDFLDRRDDKQVNVWLAAAIQEIRVGKKRIEVIRR